MFVELCGDKLDKKAKEDAGELTLDGKAGKKHLGRGANSNELLFDREKKYYDKKK